MFDEWGNFVSDFGSGGDFGFEAGFFDDGVSDPSSGGDWSIFEEAGLTNDGAGNFFQDTGAEGTSSWDFSDIVEALPDVFRTVLQVGQMWRAAQNKQVKTSSPTTVANPNGTLTTQTSTGGTVTTRMPVNQPYVASDGSLVMNNGNGTYTVTLSDGSTVTRQYPAQITASNSGNNSLLWLGLGAGALLLLGRGLR